MISLFTILYDSSMFLAYYDSSMFLAYEYAGVVKD